MQHPAVDYKLPYCSIQTPLDLNESHKRRIMVENLKNDTENEAIFLN